MTIIVNISTVRHQDQRYNTVGDWQEIESRWPSFRIAVSELQDWRYEALIAIHELVEAVLCRHAGIGDEAVTMFDRAFEATRAEGDVNEPGDDPEAPYRRQHRIATAIEMLLAAELGVEWSEYRQRIEAL